MYVETRRTAPSAAHYSVERRYLRHYLSTPLTTWFLLNFKPRTSRGLTLEISVGGLSAVLCGPPPFGERVLVRLKLLDVVFETPAIVSYSSSACTGFEFLEPPPDFLGGIEAFTQGLMLGSGPQYGIQIA